MRKFLISAVATAAAFGVLGAFAPAAFAIPPTTPPTSEVGGYPPVPTSATATTQAASAGPVVTPDPDVEGAVIAADADLPSTGSDSIVPLQVAGGLLVAGVLTVFAVRRRRQASPEPAA